MKLDVSLIDGYDAMTLEQKVEALLGLDMDPTKAGFRTQADFDKIMTENAEKKKLIKELEKKQTGEKDELTKRLEQLEEANKALERTNQIASTEAQFLGMGYSKDLAKKAAEATVDGKMADLMAAQQEFLKAHDEALKAEALKGMTPPQNGSGGDGSSKSEAEQIAERIGKAESGSMKASNDILSQYLVN